MSDKLSVKNQQTKPDQRLSLNDVSLQSVYGAKDMPPSQDPVSYLPGKE